MSQLKDLAEWLGYEVVDVDGEYVLRYRQQTGKWCERDQRATDAERLLYDTVRGLLATRDNAQSRMLVKLGLALGLAPQAISFRSLAERVAALQAENRRWREQQQGWPDLVKKIASERWVQHPLSSAGYYRNEGEQNAFNMVIRLLETGEWPL